MDSPPPAQPKVLANQMNACAGEPVHDSSYVNPSVGCQVRFALTRMYRKRFASNAIDHAFWKTLADLPMPGPANGANSAATVRQRPRVMACSAGA